MRETHGGFGGRGQAKGYRLQTAFDAAPTDISSGNPVRGMSRQRSLRGGGEPCSGRLGGSGQLHPSVRSEVEGTGAPGPWGFDPSMVEGYRKVSSFVDDVI